MPFDLLLTKLLRPPVPSGWIPRGRLFTILNEGLSRRLTLLSTPPGFGKTTLLSSWAAGLEIPSAWLTLDEGDNDLSRFLEYLTGAVRGIDAGAAESAPLFFQSMRERAQTVLTGLLNFLAGQPAPLVLILDDYHLISEEGVHEALLYFIEHLPPTTHLVISSRADPPFPLARMRGRAEVIELRQDDLRLTAEETAAFLSLTMRINLDAEDIRMLTDCTEGWIAGMQLAAVSMPRDEDPARWIQSIGSGNRYILDYLMDEVWRRQPGDVRAFLLRTSLVDRFSVDLCNSLTGGNDGRSMLERLENSNLFITPLDAGRTWYRYHRLFADLLRHRLRQENPAEIPSLHRTAAAWFEGQGWTEEAVEHCIQAGDLEKAAQLLQSSAEEYLTRGTIVTFLRRLDRLPKETLNRRPILCIYQAWAFLQNGRAAAEVEERLAAAEGNPLDPITSAKVTAVRALVAYIRGDLPLSIRLAEQALAGARLRPFLGRHLRPDRAQTGACAGDVRVCGFADPFRACIRDVDVVPVPRAFGRADRGGGLKRDGLHRRQHPTEGTRRGDGDPRRGGRIGFDPRAGVRRRVGDGFARHPVFYRRGDRACNGPSGDFPAAGIAALRRPPKGTRAVPSPRQGKPRCSASRSDRHPAIPGVPGKLRLGELRGGLRLVRIENISIRSGGSGNDPHRRRTGFDSGENFHRRADHPLGRFRRD